ncbi:MAG: galactose oxidase [Cytophagales bacterium]|nr:galactose oxidase [Cytophagales bacterium]
MNKYILMLVSVMLLGISACTESTEDTDEDGNWVKLSDYEGDTRTGAVSFVIGEEAYVGLGSDGEDYLTDFWKYDASRNFWQEIAPFPGVGRISAVAFSADGKGYVGTGYNDDLAQEEMADFWMYDPDADTWTEIAPFAGSARYSAVAFSLNGLGYVGTGYDGSYLKDFYRYNPASDTWEQSISLFGSKRESAFAFVVGSRAYVGSGVNNDQFLYDFWAFDPESDQWIDFSIEDDDDDFFDEYVDAMERFDATAFVMDDIAYIATGTGTSFQRDIISFDPQTEIWDEDFTSFEGLARGGAVSFVINGRGFITTGRSATTRHDDIWEWKPGEEYEEFD